MKAEDAEIFVELWSNVKSYIPAKDRREAAESFIAFIDNNGLVDLTLSSQDMYGICGIFDAALRIYCKENDYDEVEEDLDKEWDE